MAFSIKSTAAMMVVMSLFLAFATTKPAAQSSTPACAQQLVPCADYLNTTTTPPSSCCDGIKQAVSTELTCLCNLYNTPGLLASLGIDVQQALALTERCGVTADLSDCSNSTSAPSPTAVTPPAVPGSDGNRMAGAGLSSFLLLWASLMFY